MVPAGIQINTLGIGPIAAAFSPTWVTPQGESLGDLTNLPAGDRIFITDMSCQHPQNVGDYFILFDDINNDGNPDANEIIGVFADSGRYGLAGTHFYPFSQPLMVRYGLRAIGFGVVPSSFKINAIWVPK